MSTEHDITSIEQLEAIIGKPNEMINMKIRSELDDPMREFIARSPLLFLATWDPSGQPDVSPKGDAPGFVQLDAEGRLLIPDRPGNKLVFGFKNILANPNIGLIFAVPRMRETLRVKGRATLSNDPNLLESLQAQGKPATLCTRVTVDECFFHCGKAMIRSKLWQPEHWADPGESLLVRQIATGMELDETGAKLVEESLEQNYVDELY